MKLAIISFTQRGNTLCGALNNILSRQGYDVAAYGMKKYECPEGVQPLEISLSSWTEEMFGRMDALLYIGATGIAVRSIAPHLKDKMTDPAIVVMDEKGVFAISLVSGHLGGANELAGMLANLTGAIPVITTATDINGRFAVDVFARRQNLAISDRNAAKLISAEVLAEHPVGLVCEFPIVADVPQELTLIEGQEPFAGICGMVISFNKEKLPFKETLHLIPKIVCVGVGCRKGTPENEVEAAILETLRIHRIDLAAVARITSIELKKVEAGILAFCNKYEIPFETYSEQELMEVRGEFSQSDFVQSVTGVDSVCERSAVRGSENGKLIQKKKIQGKVTVALAIKDWSVDFE